MCRDELSFDKAEDEESKRSFVLLRTLSQRRRKSYIITPSPPYVATPIALLYHNPWRISLDVIVVHEYNSRTFESGALLDPLSNPEASATSSVGAAVDDPT